MSRRRKPRRSSPRRGRRPLGPSDQDEEDREAALVPGARFAGEGDDVLIGGPGNDVVEGTPATIGPDCAPGADELTMFTGTLSRRETLLADPLEIRLRPGSLRVRWRLKSLTRSCRLYVTSGGGAGARASGADVADQPAQAPSRSGHLQLDDHCGGHVGSRFRRPASCSHDRPVASPQATAEAARPGPGLAACSCASDAAEPIGITWLY